MAMLTLPQAELYIAQRSAGMGLDPAAVLAVSAQEGLSSAGYAGPHPDPAPGQPGAFAVGPFQLNSAGALASSPAAGLSGASASAWAWSTDGIDWALGRIASVAHGQSGSSAIGAIVRLFERPADPSGEIARAQQVYGDYYAKWWNVEDTTGSSPPSGSSTPLVTDPSQQVQGKVTDGTAGGSTPGAFTLIPGVGGWPGVKISFGFLWAILLFGGGIAAIIGGLLLYFHKEVGEAAGQVGKVAAVAAV